MLRLASYFLFLAIFRYVLFPNFCKCGLNNLKLSENKHQIEFKKGVQNI